MKNNKLLLILLSFITVLTSCMSMEPVGTTKNTGFNGANQIRAESSDSLFFDKFINNMKLNGYTFTDIDKANGFATVKPKAHPKHTNLVLSLQISYIKTSAENNVIIISGDLDNTLGVGTAFDGPIIYTEKRTNPRIAWDEIISQFDGIPNVSFTFKRV